MGIKMNIAFIPVRGGSKSIPLKNIKKICGKPLVYWTVKAACGCKHIDKVYVATDNDEIKKVICSFKTTDEVNLFEKIEVIGRSAKSASDTASTELAMLEFAQNYEFDNVVLIQATSPLLVSDDLDRGFEVFSKEGTDSVLSAVRQKRFNWKIDKNDFAYPINYDVFKRPRRQEFDGYMVENGAFYITSKVNLLKSQNRVCGNIRICEMKADTFFEIDELNDWIISEALMQRNGITSSTEMPEIKMFLTDCDGCLTDGGMYYSEHGDEMKKFNTRDGVGVALLKEKGILTGIITSECIELNRRRADKLKIEILEIGCKDKLEVVKKLCEKYDIAFDNIAYVGDDINDLEVMKMVGYSCCPADAVPQIQEVAEYIAKAKGGEGVIRECVSKILN